MLLDRCMGCESFLVLDGGMCICWRESQHDSTGTRVSLCDACAARIRNDDQLLCQLVDVRISIEEDHAR